MNMASEMLVLLNLGRVYQEKVTMNFKETRVFCIPWLCSPVILLFILT